MFIFEELLEIDADADMRSVCRRLGAVEWQTEPWPPELPSEFAKEGDCA